MRASSTSVSRCSSSTWRKVGVSLSRSVEAFNKAVGSFEQRVLPQTRRLRELGAEGARPLAAPERDRARRARARRLIRSALWRVSVQAHEHHDSRAQGGFIMRTIRRLANASIPAIALASALSATPAAATDCNRDSTVIGLTDDQRLVRFRECKPSRFNEIGDITGLSGSDTALVGIDYRVQNGVLYGLGNGGGIYVFIDKDTAAATFVSQLSRALEGASFGVDFNPAADRLRIVSDTGQNLRHDVNPGGLPTTADGTLNYTAGTPATGVSGAAYTNNDLDATTATTLFDIDATLDQVVIQSPPNTGALAPTGKLTVDASAPIGFDIFSRLRREVAVDNYGLASLVVAGHPVLYRIEVLTGKATRVGRLDSTLLDLAIRLDHDRARAAGLPRRAQRRSLRLDHLDGPEPLELRQRSPSPGRPARSRARSGCRCACATAAMSCRRHRAHARAIGVEAVLAAARTRRGRRARRSPRRRSRAPSRSCPSRACAPRRAPPRRAARCARARARRAGCRAPRASSRRA